MKSLFVLLLASCVIYSVYSAQAIAKKKPGTPGDCYEESYSLGEMKFGDEKRAPNDCLRITCQSNGDIVYHSCGSVGVSGNNCRLSEVDLTKNYPECCPQPVCN